MRAVFDTNVLVSAALLPRSVPRRALSAALGAGRVLASAVTLAELHEVLTRPRFDRRAPLEGRMEFFAAVVLLVEEVDTSTPVAACRDPDDDKFLEVAVNGRATHVVTGDQDLLVLHPFRGIPIVTPAAFLAEITP